MFVFFLYQLKGFVFAPTLLEMVSHVKLIGTARATVSFE